jgi:hypothetical protein
MNLLDINLLPRGVLASLWNDERPQSKKFTRITWLEGSSINVGLY